jgi:hypothetical protein
VADADPPLGPAALTVYVPVTGAARAKLYVRLPVVFVWAVPLSITKPPGSVVTTSTASSIPKLVPVMLTVLPMRLALTAGGVSAEMRPGSTSEVSSRKTWSAATHRTTNRARTI